MLRKIHKLLDGIINYKITKQLINLKYNGYLYECGWINSLVRKEPLDINDKPMPWATLPFIEFINNRLNRHMGVFEYGSGMSTLYYANRVNSIISIEHDRKWYEYLVTKIPCNAKLLYNKLEYGGEYCKAILKVGSKYDIVIVDGRDRVRCLMNSIECLNDGGVVILDDSVRDEYKQGIDYLLDKGFKKIDFVGIQLGYSNKNCTTIFYKNNNCLGI